MKFETSPKLVLKSVGPSLVPFFKTVAIFFVLFPNAILRENIWSILFKCAPVASLIAFVFLHGMSLTEFHSYSRRIVAGLCFSILGDAFLVYSQYFMHGLVMFAIGHILYTSAFGFRPFRIARLAPLVVVGSIFFAFLLPGLPDKLVWPTLVYMCCITIMLWRAVSRVEFSNGLWTWTSMCSFLGAILFSLSDMAIALVKFRFPFLGHNFFIMVTYYFAQCGIALSVVDNQLDRALELSSRQLTQQETVETAGTSAATSPVSISPSRKLLKSN